MRKGFLNSPPPAKAPAKVEATLPAPPVITKPLVKKDGVTLLQAYWRGRRVRKNMEKPFSKLVMHFPTMIVGNDPDIIFPRAENNQFIIVGCGGFDIFNLVLSLASPTVMDKYSYKNTPKLFLVDASKEVNEFWKIIKSCMAKAKDLQDFYRNLGKADSILEPLSSSLYDFQGGKKTIAWCFQNILNVSHQFEKCSRTEFGKKSDSEIQKSLFQFIKGVIDKMTLILGFWENQETFGYIKKFAYNMPVYVNASNIVEYMGYYGAEAEVDRILENIAALTPKVVIHTRTDLKDGDDGPCPEHVIVLKNEAPAALVKAILSAEKFAPLIRNSDSSSNQVSDEASRRRLT